MELYAKPLKRDWVERAVFSRACFGKAKLRRSSLDFRPRVPSGDRGNWG